MGSAAEWTVDLGDIYTDVVDADSATLEQAWAAQPAWLAEEIEAMPMGCTR